MRWFLFGAVLLTGVVLIGANYQKAEKPEEPNTVEELDLEEYLGKWYAVASITKFFNRSCVWGNTAEYSLREDGRIDVLNSCYTEEGEKREVRAVAWRPDDSEPGKLKVSFIPLFGYRLFPADYWVLELGDNYEYAVVGDPSRSFGWILSRTPELEEGKLREIANRLEQIGYDFSDFKLNPQSPPEND